MRDAMRSRWAVGVAVLGLALFLTGCGDGNLFEGQSDSSGRQADLEAGLEALDSSDWAAAQRIFSGMDQSDPEVRKYLASAYVGEAGFDVLTLVEEIDAAQGDDDSLYAMVTGIFDDGDGSLSQAEIAAKVDLLLESLVALGAYDPSVPRAGRAAGAVSFGTIAAENQFQTGLYSALYVVMAVVEQLSDPATQQVLLTLAALQDADPCQVIGPVPAAADDGGVVAPAAADDLLALVRQAVQVIEPEYMGGQFDNDIAVELDQFLTEIGYLPDGSVSDTELRGYLYGLVDATCTQPAP